MYKILIIEDDLAMAQAIQREMTRWGNEAEYLEDFQNVLTEFAEYGPHLVLMTSRFLFTTDTTGAARSGRSPACRSFLFPRRRII